MIHGFLFSEFSHSSPHETDCACLGYPKGKGFINSIDCYGRMHRRVTLQEEPFRLTGFANNNSPVQDSVAAVLQRRHFGRHGCLDRKGLAAFGAIILFHVIASNLDRYFYMKIAPTTLTNLIKSRLLKSLGGVKTHLIVSHVRFSFIITAFSTACSKII